MDPKDLGNGTSVVWSEDEAETAKHGPDNPNQGYFVISNTETPGGERPFLRGPFATEAEAETASRAVEWTEEMLTTEWPKPRPQD